MDSIVLLLATIITASTPLLFAALGELITERSGVLNLGVEGMMLTGAVTGFGAVVVTQSAIVAVFVAMIAAMLIASIFAVIVLKLQASQVATGLALTIFGVGLSALLGREFVGVAYDGLPKLSLGFVNEIPIVGPLIFSHDALVYLSLIMVFAVQYFLEKTHGGLILRAVGDSHDAAHALGYNVIKVRFLAILFGGAMSGLAGAYLALSYSPMWIENMTAGRGWIALALVVFATWRPYRVLAGAYLFGGISILQLYGQAFGVGIPSQFMSMLPYIATIVVLVLISRDQQRVRRNAPAMLGIPFHSAS